MKEKKVESIEIVKERRDRSQDWERMAEPALPAPRKQSGRRKESKSGADRLELSSPKVLTGKKFQTKGAPTAPDRSDPAAAKLQTPREKAKWTVLVYLAGDNNLEEYMAEDLLDLEKVGSSPDMNIIAQIDRGADCDTSVVKHGGKPGMVRYYVHKSPDPQKITSPELRDMGHTDSAQFRYFKNFLTWGMKTYPADRYFIIADSHGVGQRGLITDEGGLKPNIISIPDFRSALEGAEKDAGVDKDQVLLGMDNCLMAQTEFAYELKDSAAMMLASQSTVSTDNWRMNELFADPHIADYDIPQMAAHVFEANNLDLMEEGKNPPEIKKPRIATAALLDLSQAGKLKEAVKNLETAVMKSSEPQAKIKQILAVKSRSGFFSHSQFSYYASDFYAAAQKLAKDKSIQDPELKKAAKNLAGVLHQVIVENSHRDSLEHGHNANGLGILTSGNAEMFVNINYQNLAFSKDTGWGQFVSQYGKELTLQEMDQDLYDTEIAEPQFREIAKLSRQTLKDFSGLDKEFARLNKDLEKINDKPYTTPRDRHRESAERISKFSVIDKIFQANKNIKSPHLQEIINSIYENLVLTCVDTPQFLPDLLKGTLALLSAQEGKINGETIIKGASAYLQEGAGMRGVKEVQADLKVAFDEARVMRYQYPRPDMTEIEGRIAKLQEEGLRRALYESYGATTLLNLGYATRNPRLVNLKNYTGADDLEFIRRLAGMQPKPATQGVN